MTADTEVQKLIDENPGLADRLDERQRRSYLRAHPLALSLSVSAIVTGLLLLLFPWFGDGSSALAVMPDWAQYAWAVTFAAGGLLATYGFLAFERKAEATGSLLMASAYLVTFLTVVAARGIQGVAPGLFLLFLAVGFYARVLFVQRGAA